MSLENMSQRKWQSVREYGNTIQEIPKGNSGVRFRKQNGIHWAFPGGASGKESTCQGRRHKRCGQENGNPLQ